MDLEKVRDLFFPWGTYCICCGNFIDQSRTYCLCDHCIRQIGWGNVEIAPCSLLDNQFTGAAAEALKRREAQGKGIPVDSIRACMKYGLYERRLIFELKYNGHTYVARILADMLYDRIKNDSAAAMQLASADYIVPVPIHKEKYRKRGFNQAEKIAIHLGRLLKIPVLKDGHGLVRITSTTAQRSVAGAERLENLAGALGPMVGSRDFCRLTERVQGKSLILLDDILTTGATAIQCGLVLKDAGAAKVHVLTIAAGNDHAKGFFLGR